MTEKDPNLNRLRWAQVEELYHSASVLDVDSREAFLTNACDDPSVKEEVLALLESSDHEAGFLEEPAFAVGMKLMETEAGMMTGQTIGHYKLLQLLGSGGMGDVYLSRDLTLGRQVALKLLTPQITENNDLTRRFEREARLASRISHPNVAHIYEIGESGGQHYIAMEYVSGKTLRQRLREGPITCREAVELTSQILAALKSAHSLGIIHRDIKPENIMLSEDGYVKVLDFGIAKLSPTEAPDVPGDVDTLLLSSLRTEPAVLLGTTFYMSPEQLRKQPLDRRTDLWSTGVVLHEMLLGQRPFQGEEFSEVLVAILEREPAGIDDPRIPTALRVILRKSLSKSPDDRYQTPDDMLADLSAINADNADTVTDDRKADTPTNQDAARARRTMNDGTGRLNTIRERIDTIKTLFFKGNEPAILRPQVFVATFILLAITGVIFSYFVSSRDLQAKFERVNLLFGGLTDIAISRDGKFIASVVSESGKQSIHIMELATSSDLAIVPPSAVGYSGLSFSNDGNYVYFLENETEGAVLYRVSKFGGAQRKLLANVNTAVSFSPDGNQIVFVRHNQTDDTPELIVASADGSSPNVIEKRTREDADTFLIDRNGPGPVWSPDGKSIACPTQNLSRSPQEMNLEIIDPEMRNIRRLNTQPWYEISGVTWLADGSALILAVKESQTTPSQLLAISYPSGNVQKISDEPNSYTRLSTTANANQFVTLRVEENSSIWRVPSGNAENMSLANVQQRSGVFEVASLKDKGFIYSVFDGKHWNLWTQDSSGQSRQLTFETNDNYRPTITPDGRSVVFASSRQNMSNIWRMNVDGTEQKQLTFGPYADMPSLTPDGNWVIYRTGNELRKIPTNGGQSVKLLTASAFSPTVSPDGRLLAFRTNETPDSKTFIIKVCDLATLQTVATFHTSGTTDPMAALRWNQDGSGLGYVSTVDGAANIWRQPLKGGEPEQLTRFKEGEIRSFAWAANDELIVVRNTRTSIPLIVTVF
ncbi:MAG TPA: protein kinase [Pyrinomonadaceae bacterium]|nr:protein kinase [Pyrinomonadaceae bacterium]